MTTKKLNRGIRLEPILNARCNAQAAESHLTFSEWVRQILRRETGLMMKKARNSAA